MKPKVEWIDVDLTKDKKELPKPLNHISGGYYWVISDCGIHGLHMRPSWWTGYKFLDLNNERIIKFARMEFPDLPSNNS